MAWSIKHDASTGIVEVVYVGRVSGAELKEAASGRISLQQQTGANAVLIDASQVEQLAAGLADALSLPASLLDAVEADRKSRMALILPLQKSAREAAQFWETACLNRGWTAKTFEDRQSAMDWLRDAALAS